MKNEMMERMVMRIVGIQRGVSELVYEAAKE